MSETFRGYVLKIEAAPQEDFIGFLHTYAHVFLKSGNQKVDVYTDEPRFEAAFLAAYKPLANSPPLIEVVYEKVTKDKVKKVERVVLCRDLTL